MHHHEDNLDDAALVRLVLGGEREAFGPLLLRHHASVARLCRALLGSDAEAQDVAQEATLQAFLGLARLREPGHFGAWLHAIAANLARSELRRRRPLSVEGLGEGEPLALLWTGTMPAPEDVQAAREVHDAIVAALGELSAVNREAVIGFYLQGYSYLELAELLRVPLSTVKGRLFKGRRQLVLSLREVAQEVLRPDSRQEECEMQAGEMVEVSVDSVRTGQADGEEVRIVVLRDDTSGRLLPVWIGHFEARSIEVVLVGEQPARPLTHDLTLRLLEAVGASVQRVELNNLVDTTFYAEITVALGDQTHRVDARLSDAVALAVRTGAPIYVSRALLDTAGVDREADKQGDSASS